MFIVKSCAWRSNEALLFALVVNLLGQIPHLVNLSFRSTESFLLFPTKENTKRDGDKTLAESSYSLAIISLERKLHIVVQYLLYFRNIDGSFGEPMVEQSSRQV